MYLLSYKEVTSLYILAQMIEPIGLELHHFHLHITQLFDPPSARQCLQSVSLALDVLRYVEIITDSQYRVFNSQLGSLYRLLKNIQQGEEDRLSDEIDKLFGGIDGLPF